MIGELSGHGTADTRYPIPDTHSLFPIPHSQAPFLPEYTEARRREDAYALLGFTTDSHPMELYRERLRRWRITPSTELHRHVGQTVLCAGMLTTAKPVHTARDEPMQFATFDDGHGLVETVMFPDIHRKRSHVLFDQGPFLFRGIVEQEWGAISVTMTGLERLERAGDQKRDARSEKGEARSKK